MAFYLSVPGPMSNDTGKSLAMLYLFYSVDYKITSEDCVRFENYYGGSFEGFKEAKDTIVAECERILSGEQSSGSSLFAPNYYNRLV